MYHLHPLAGKRMGQFAIDLGRKLGWRLIIIPQTVDGETLECGDVNFVYESTEIVLVWEVSNHYE
jgi:proteic killer suppression protein